MNCFPTFRQIQLLIHYFITFRSNSRLKGSYKGTMNDLYTDLQLNTSEGNVALKGTLKNITDKKNAVYDIAASTDNLAAGKTDAGQFDR